MRRGGVYSNFRLQAKECDIYNLLVFQIVGTQLYKNGTVFIDILKS